MTVRGVAAVCRECISALQSIHCAVGAQGFLVPACHTKANTEVTKLTGEVASPTTAVCSAVPCRFEVLANSIDNCQPLSVMSHVSDLVRCDVLPRRRVLCHPPSVSSLMSFLGVIQMSRVIRCLTMSPVYRARCELTRR